MAAGDLTCTNVGIYNIGSSSLANAINALNLPAATDFIFLIPTANGRQVYLMKVVRAA